MLDGEDGRFKGSFGHPGQERIRQSFGMDKDAGELRKEPSEFDDHAVVARLNLMWQQRLLQIAMAGIAKVTMVSRHNPRSIVHHAIRP